MSTSALLIGEACEQGEPWPEDCNKLWKEIDQGWPGYRTEGVHYAARIKLLHTSGETVNERMLLFRTPESRGLHLAADQAKACNANLSETVQGAQVYRIPTQDGTKHLIVIDRMAAIQLEAPATFNVDKLVRSALKRERDFKR